MSEPTLVEKKKGRPKKNKVENTTSESTSAGPKKRGRPKKAETSKQEESINDIDAYLKEIDDQIAKESAKLEKTKKELEKNSNISNKKK